MDKILLTPEQAILEIKSEWDVYERCRDRTIIAGKSSHTLRKLFEKETGISLPFICIWRTQDAMVKQYGGVKKNPLEYHEHVNGNGSCPYCGGHTDGCCGCNGTGYNISD